MDVPASILLFADNPFMSGPVREWTSRSGCGWLGATADMAEALKLCRGEHAYVLVCEDAGVDWVEVVARFNRTFPRPKLLILARRFTSAFASRAKAAEIDGVIRSGLGMEADLRRAFAAFGAGGKWFCAEYLQAVDALESDPAALSNQLSTQELALLPDFGCGLSDEAIAIRHSLAAATAKTHRKRIMRKLGLHSSRDLMRLAIARGVVTVKSFVTEAPTVQAEARHAELLRAVG